MPGIFFTSFVCLKVSIIKNKMKRKKSAVALKRIQITGPHSWPFLFIRSWVDPGCLDV